MTFEKNKNKNKKNITSSQKFKITINTKCVLEVLSGGRGKYWAFYSITLNNTVVQQHNALMDNFLHNKTINF